MQQTITLEAIQKMTPEEVAALNKKMAKRAMLYFGTLFVVKGAILYGIHHWAKKVNAS